MAVDMFIKIGDVDGESADKTHAKEIDVLAWSWGMSSPAACMWAVAAAPARSVSRTSR